MHRNKLYLSLFLAIAGSLLMTNCLANPLRAPDPDDNKLYFLCTGGLSKLFHVTSSNKSGLDDVLWRRVSALLIAAEIESQFKHYPSCVNKLERAHYYLIQAGKTVPE